MYEEKNKWFKFYKFRVCFGLRSSQVYIKRLEKVKFHEEDRRGFRQRRFEEASRSTLYFEESAVKEWMRNRPNEAPSSWLQGTHPLAIREEYFDIDKSGQRSMDREIEILKRNVQNEFLFFQESYSDLNL